MTLEGQREIPENVPIPSIVGHGTPSHENKGRLTDIMFNMGLRFFWGHCKMTSPSTDS
jgi:hypothetical protein